MNEVQTRAGVKYVNKELAWLGPTTLIVLDKYSSKVTAGHATIGKADYAARWLKKAHENANAAAADL